jgi:hypothetical protein
MRKTVWIASASIVVGLVAAGLSYAQQPQNFDNVQEHILPVQGNVYMMVAPAATHAFRRQTAS